MDVYKTGKGAWQINYRSDGKQKQIYLGINHTQASANRAGDVIRELLLCRYRGDVPPTDLMKRLKMLESRIQASIERHGLLGGWTGGVTLGELIDRFMETKSGIKEVSIRTFSDRFNRVRHYFDCSRPASSVTEDDASSFKAHLLKERGFSPVSAAASITDCRSMYRYAIRKKLVVENPFECIVAGPLTNDSRFRFIERELIEKTLQYCIGDHVKFGVMLSRYAGLRIPSEIRHMKYSDFGKEGFFVHENTKTGRREVPFFHELREMFYSLKERNRKDEYVFPRSMVSKWGLTSRYVGALERGKIERWPRLFNNLRASCVTEYDELGFTEKTLDSIFGNTERIRKRHYSGFRKDRAFMQILGTKKSIVDELIENGGHVDGVIETEKIDLLIRYLESLKVSRVSFEPEKSGLFRGP